MSATNKVTYAKKAAGKKPAIDTPIEEEEVTQPAPASPVAEEEPLCMDLLPVIRPALVRQNGTSKKQSRSVTIAGFLNTKTEYGNYEVHIHPQVYATLLDIQKSDFQLGEGTKSPLRVWKDDHTVRVKIDPELCALHNYDSLIGKNVRVHGKCSTYSFKPPGGEQLVGWSVNALKIEPIA